MLRNVPHADEASARLAELLRAAWRAQEAEVEAETERLMLQLAVEPYGADEPVAPTRLVRRPRRRLLVRRLLRGGR